MLDLGADRKPNIFSHELVSKQIENTKGLFKRLAHSYLDQMEVSAPLVPLALRTSSQSLVAALLLETAQGSQTSPSRGTEILLATVYLPEL